jgi:tryptophan-rich sensory protein
MARDARTAMRALAFGASVGLTAAATRRDARCVPLHAAASSRWRPPARVFRAVWWTLYVTTGVAWARAGGALDAPMGALVAACCGWLVVFSCHADARRATARDVGVGAPLLAEALLVAAAAIAVVSTVLAARADGPAGAALAPTAAWLTFAATAL